MSAVDVDAPVVADRVREMEFLRWAVLVGLELWPWISRFADDFDQRLLVVYDVIARWRDLGPHGRRAQPYGLDGFVAAYMTGVECPGFDPDNYVSPGLDVTRQAWQARIQTLTQRQGDRR